ncbi:RicAFT regulatory complex protein RicA family protein [Listeria costaricensis]|uniref:RicAFT regulatory complex protein RicA family protein n=1 Tax=Listeria costaricensis TaxID=2026604 RepID=UPI000C08265A|nr:YlbF family regulator [Listeria costaricensis]
MAYQRDELIQEAKKIRQTLRQTDEIKAYQAAEERINQNKKIAQKVNQIKALQKQAVNLEHYGKYQALKQTEQEIDRLQNELETLPVVAEFRRTQTEANDLLQALTKEIEERVSRHLDTEE